jgi:hypothetical protein
MVVPNLFPVQPTNLRAPQSAESTENQECFQLGVVAGFQERGHFFWGQNLRVRWNSRRLLRFFCGSRGTVIQNPFALCIPEQSDQRDAVVKPGSECLETLEEFVNVLDGNGPDFGGERSTRLAQVLLYGTDVPGASSRLAGFLDKFVGNGTEVGGFKSFFQVWVVAFVEGDKFFEWDLCHSLGLPRKTQTCGGSFGCAFDHVGCYVNEVREGAHHFSFSFDALMP